VKVKRFLLVPMLLSSLLYTGCFWSGNDASTDAPSSVSNRKIPPGASLKIGIKSQNELQAALRGQTSARAVFELKLIKQGNTANPFILMRKEADIIDQSASVSFTSVPVLPVIARLTLEGASIDAKTSFHAGIDLKPGENTVMLVASGSAEAEDVIARAAIKSANDYSTMTSISGALFANLQQTYNSLAATDQTNPDALFSAYQNKLANTQVSDLAGGAAHSLILRNDGSFVAFGSNASSQLGKNNVSEEFERRFVTFHSIVHQIAAGGDFSLLLDNNGKVYSCGANDDGQLGLTGTSIYAYPIEITNLTNIKSISAGYSNGCAIDISDNLYTWGLNSSGQLGTGATSTSELPGLVQSSVKQAAIGSNFILIVKNDGTVWACGDNQAAQIGSDVGKQTSSFVQVPGLANITMVAAGSLHCLALDSNGEVYSWGYNYSGQTGLATSNYAIESPSKITALSGIASIYAGNNHSIALDGSGRLFGWGDSSKAQLADVASSNSPVEITAVTGVSILGCGQNHNLALGDQALTWGSNNAGQIGNGQSSDTGISVPAERNFIW
jgi:alpha-tubulin suppressor-like RCC1 family protein